MIRKDTVVTHISQEMGFLWSAQRLWFCLWLDKIMEWSHFVSFVTVTD